MIKSWGHRYNHTPIVIDHAAKGSEGKGAAAYEFGSIFKRARVGTSLYLKQAESLDRYTTVIDLYHPKSNTVVVDMRKSAQPLVRFTIRFDDPDGPITFEPKAKDWDRISDLPDEPVAVEQAAALWNLSTTQSRRILSEAVAQGRVTAWQVEGSKRLLYQLVQPAA